MTLALDLTQDVVSLTTTLVDVPSVSLDEKELADAVEGALVGLAGLTVQRFGNTIVARTELGLAERVVLAGHLDTVPIHDNLPSRNDGTFLHGCGTGDMKAGDAVILRLAHAVGTGGLMPSRDLTFVLYEAEEIESAHNGLRRLSESDPELLAADFAILMEGSRADVEAGCQGTLRVEVRTTGVRAHSARAWMGENAIHAAAPILARLNDYQPRRPLVDGLEFHEGLNAVKISGGVAGNVIPDECVVTVNHRFAPDRSEAEALAFVEEFLGGFDVSVVDSAPGALPGLDLPAAAAFVQAVATFGGAEVRPKLGWTDVARFTVLGIPAVNYGPGDPALAHRQDEKVEIAKIVECERVLRAWLEER